MWKIKLNIARNTKQKRSSPKFRNRASQKPKRW